MRKTIFTILLVAISSMCLDLCAAPKKPKSEKKTVVYLTTIHCNNCANKVRENIAFEKGVKELKVDAEDKTVKVVFETAKTDTLTLRKAINKLGYGAKVVSYE